MDGLHFVSAYKDFNLWCSFRCLKNASSGPRRVWKQQCRVYRRGKGYEKLPAFVVSPQRHWGRAEKWRGDCRPGPLTVLYNPRGKGRNCSLPNTNGWHGVLTKEAVMYNMVGTYVTKCKRRTGHWWFQGFKARHPNLTVRMPQPLSYANSTKEVVNYQHLLVANHAP